MNDKMDIPYLKNSLLENFLESRELTQKDFKQIYNKVCHIYENEIKHWKEKCEKLEKDNLRMKKVMDSDISSSIQSGFEKMQSMMNNGGPVPRMFSIVIDPNKVENNDNSNASKNPEKIRQESIFLENLKKQILKEANNEVEKKNNENLKRIFNENLENDKNSFFISDSIINKTNGNTEYELFNPFNSKLNNYLEKIFNPTEENKNQTKTNPSQSNNEIIQKMINKKDKSIDLANFFDKIMKITNDKNKNSTDLFNLWKENKDIVKSIMEENDYKLINKKINSIYYNPGLETILKKQRIESHLQIFLFQKYLFK